MRVRKLTVVWAVLVAGISVLIPFLCVDLGRDSPPSPGDYRKTIVSARKGLFEGSFRYTILRKATEGGTQSFRLTVRGARAQLPAGARSPDGAGDVRVGALMGARLRCAGSRIACTANSSERQPVLTPRDSAEWNWTIATPEAGKATVTLTLTAYYEGTHEVLAETSPIEQDLTAEEEGNFWGMIGDSWQWFAAFVGVLAGAVPLLEYLERRRSRTADGEEAAEGRAPAV